MKVSSWISVPLFLWLSVCAQVTSTYALTNNERGKQLFKNCQSCHGEKGEGTKSLGAPAIAGLSEWYVKAQLEKFRSGVRGQHPRDNEGNRMRPMAKTLKVKGEVDDLPLVAAYVAELAPPPPHQEFSLGRADVGRGKRLYAPCIACHGAQGEGNKLVSAPAIAGQEDWYLFAQLKKFKDGLRGADPSKDPMGATMAPMAKTLVDDQAMRDVIAYIMTLRLGKNSQ